jgi:hypothetical protein
VWKGFDTALLDDGMVTWQGIGEALFGWPKLIFLAVPGAALAVHFLF